MKRTARALATAATLGLMGRWLRRHTRAYDGYFAYEYPAYTGGVVTAIAVDLVNGRFRHRRVVGPAVVYQRGYLPR